MINYCCKIIRFYLFIFTGDQIKILDSPVDQTVGKGHTVSFTCAVGFTGDEAEEQDLRVRWKHEGEALDQRTDRYTLADNGQKLILRDVDYRDEGQYTCVASIRGQAEREKSSARLRVRGNQTCQGYSQESSQPDLMSEVNIQGPCTGQNTSQRSVCKSEVCVQVRGLCTSQRSMYR